MAMLKHIAISLDDISVWCRENNKRLDESCKAYFEKLMMLLELQVKLDVPIFTVYLLPDSPNKSSDDFLAFSDLIAIFFNQLSENTLISGHKIKISIFGKWYHLPGKVIESLKNIIENTKNNNSFFANFCINYDGQEEIVDACRLVAKQVELGKINPEMITKDSVKESLYSSNFMPPEIILIYGEKKLSGLLLWDSVNSKIIFAGKSFMDFEEGDLKKFIE